MAFRSADILANLGPTGSTVASVPAPEQPQGSPEPATPQSAAPKLSTASQGQGISFQRNIFVEQSGTGLNLDKELKKAEGEGKKTEWVTMSPEMQRQFSTFLNNHLQNLVSIRDPKVLQNPAHLHDKELLGRLTTNDAPDSTKIQQFLSKPEGWMITMELIEHQTALELFGRALYAARIPPGERQTMSDEATIRFDIDRGILNKFVLDTVIPRLRPFKSAAQTIGLSSALGANAGTIISSVLGPPSAVAQGGLMGFGLGAGAGLAGVAGHKVWRSLVEQGVRIEIRQCAGALQSIQNDRQEAAYLKALVGIDVDDFQIAGGNIELKQGKSYQTRGSDNDLQREIMEKVYTREEFYNSLGIESDAIDALPEQFLFRFTEGQPEQTRARWQARVQEHFKANKGGIRDAGRHKIGQPGFDSDNLDFAGNLKRFRRARAGAMMDMIQELATREVTRTANARGGESVKAKLKAWSTDESAEFQRRQKTHTEAKAALEGDKVMLTGARAKIDGYTETLKSLTAAREEVLIEHPRYGLLGSAEDYLKELSDRLEDPAFTNSIPAKRTALDTAKKADIVVAIRALGRIDDPEVYRGLVRGIEEDADKGYQGLYERIDREEAEIQKKEVDFKKILGLMHNQQKSLGETEPATLTLKEVMTNMNEYFTTFVGTPTVPGWGITEADLQSLSVDELMARINAANAANNTHGWPEAENKRSEHRGKVILASIEARARAVELADPTRAGRLGDYTRLTSAVGHGMTDNQLRLLTVPEIMGEITRKITVATGAAPIAGTLPTIAQVENAKQEGLNRLFVRQNTWTSYETEIDRRIKLEDETLARTDLTAEKERLEITDEVMSRQGQIFEKIYSDFPSDPQKFVDDRPVDPNDATLGAAERAPFGPTAAQLPRGYLEIMNLIFDYKGRPDRNDYFTKLLRILPPRDLSLLLNDSLTLGLSAGTTIDATLQRMGQRISGRIGSIEMRGALEAVINHLRETALAL